MIHYPYRGSAYALLRLGYETPRTDLRVHYHKFVVPATNSPLDCW